MEGSRVTPEAHSLTGGVVDIYDTITAIYNRWPGQNIPNDYFCLSLGPRQPGKRWGSLSLLLRHGARTLLKLTALA